MANETRSGATRESMETTDGNLLSRETSPYLLQHKDNPVHWRPWGPEALAEAKATNRPILLSVGYAACHWCHVMAHESFENDEIAAQMNDLFVNIKVDREERPDIDTIYQSALHMLGEQGGWPLTMFLTPDGEPFWGGTYFPPSARWGRPGLPEILTAIAKTYREAPDRVANNVSALRDGLAALANPKSGDGVTRDQADQYAQRLAGAMDPVHGGIGDAPKFPQASILRQLWSASRRLGDSAMRDSVLFALRKMCEGGIYDHLGGGFARYTVDRAWLVPHFEKMLYDNAQLLELLALAWLETGDPLYERRAAETVDWLIDDMRQPEGGFASARDADSEGEEGKYYVWTEAEVDRLLGPRSAAFKRIYDVTPQGNWEGKNILNRLLLEEAPDENTEADMAEAREILLAARLGRVPPLKDDKVLADWNGMTAAALAMAGQAFRRPDWIRAARDAFDFVAGPMAEGSRLRHSYREGRARHAATLDDYAAMMRAALTLHEVTGDQAFLDHALTWAEILDRHYRDTDGGGYFLTPDDAEALVARTKSASDNATPAGNGILVTVYWKLHALTGDPVFLARSDEIVRAFSGELDRNFYPYSNLIDGGLLPSEGAQIVIVGARGGVETDALLRAAVEAPIPERVLTVVPPDAALPEGHPAHGKALGEGMPAAAFVCTGPVCSLPITDPEALRAALTPG
jgi:uncharacterized protein YyaL (SSP411 family)